MLSNNSEDKNLSSGLEVRTIYKVYYDDGKHFAAMLIEIRGNLLVFRNSLGAQIALNVNKIDWMAPTRNQPAKTEVV